jgi:hypothetical protein
LDFAVILLPESAASSSAGTYSVWFVVRDNNTGRTGSVLTPLATK